MTTEVSALPENGIKAVNPARSEATRKAWETRKKAKAMPDQSTTELRTAIQRVFEKREEYAAVRNELAEMEAALDRLIERIGSK